VVRELLDRWMGQTFLGRQCTYGEDRLAPTLIGCPVSPNYQRPSVETPPSLRVEEKEARSVANCAWCEQLEDPVLNERFILRLQNISIEGCR
jgi:hypothetical protein